MSTAEQIKVTYGGIEITYFERENIWKFELRGRERKAESLGKAKEAIDKPAPDSKKPFSRIPAYIDTYEGFSKVEITSIADDSWRGTPYVWISKDGKREKKSANSMYAVSPENDALMAQYVELKKQEDKLNKQAREVAERLAKIDLSGCE